MSSIAAFAQPNSVESFSISSDARNDQKNGIGSIEVVFVFRFARDIKPGDLKSLRFQASGSNLSAAINKSGKFDYPARSVLRVVVPLSEVMAAGAVFADQTTVITFTSIMNLSEDRVQEASATYDFVAQKEVTIKPVFRYEAGEQVASAEHKEGATPVVDNSQTGAISQNESLGISQETSPTTAQPSSSSSASSEIPLEFLPPVIMQDQQQ